MSIFYAEGNFESAKDLFRKKTLYKGRLIEAGANGDDHIVDFNFGEKFFYGRVNRFFVPIQLVAGGRLQLKRFNQDLLAVASSRAAAVNFVVDAFNDMAQQFRKCTATGQINTSDPFLSNLTIYKAYIEPPVAYAEHLRKYFNALAQQFKNQQRKVRNFDEFIVELLAMLTDSAGKIAFTKPGFIKSRYCSIASSGLALEIADLDVTNDDQKIKDFIDSMNWDFFVNACNSYGFMIDQNIPWRIVADIDSESMQHYVSQYNLRGTDEILNLGYSRVHGTYYRDRFKYDLYNLYNRVTPNSFREQEECQGATISKKVYPRKYALNEFLSRYSEAYFLNLYFKIRSIEEEAPPSDNELSILYDDCIELYKSNGVYRSLCGHIK